MIKVRTFLVASVILLALELSKANADSLNDLFDGLISNVLSLNLKEAVGSALLDKARSAKEAFLEFAPHSIPVAKKHADFFVRQVTKFLRQGKISENEAAILSRNASRLIEALEGTSYNTVTKDGGYLEINDPQSSIYGASIQVPPGGMGEGIVVFAREESDPPSLPSNVEGAGPAVDFGPEGFVFPVAVTIGVPYSEIAGTDENDLRLMVYDRRLESWVEVPVFFQDRTKRLMYAEVSHFSLYRVVKPSGRTQSNPGMPYFGTTALWPSVTAAGQSTVIVIDLRDPDGEVPGNIESLEVRDGLGELIARLKKGDYYFDTANKIMYDAGRTNLPYQFYLKVLRGQLIPSGLYTITARDRNGNTAVLHKSVNINPIPIVDASKVTVRDQGRGEWVNADGFEGIKLDQPLTLKWEPVFYGGAPVYYRVVVRNANGTTIYRTPRSAACEVTIGSSDLAAVLDYNSLYTVRIEAYDNEYPADACNRSESRNIWMSTEGASLGGPVFRYAYCRVNKPYSSSPFLQCLAAVNGGLGGESITDQVAIYVSTPWGGKEKVGNWYYWLRSLEGPYLEAGSNFVIDPIPKGHYIFEAMDGDGRKVVLRDYLERDHILPEPVTLSPKDGEILTTTTPVFSWEDVEEARAYSFLIEEWTGSSWKNVFLSPFVFGTSYKVPGGFLNFGKSYRWRLRCSDGEGAWLMDSWTYAAPVIFAVGE